MPNFATEPSQVMNNPLARQQVEFILDLGPLVRIGRSGLPLNFRFPAACQFEVERNETRLILWDVIFCKNRVNRAFHNAQHAIDAIIRFDCQEILPFAECISRANVYAVRVFALDAAFGHDECHAISFTVTQRWPRIAVAFVIASP